MAPLMKTRRGPSPYTRGTCVVLFSDEKKEPSTLKDCYIGIIASKKRDQKSFICQWFYQFHDLDENVKKNLPEPPMENELYLTKHKDENEYSSIICSCHVLEKGEYMEWKKKNDVMGNNSKEEKDHRLENNEENNNNGNNNNNNKKKPRLPLVQLPRTFICRYEYDIGTKTFSVISDPPWKYPMSPNTEEVAIGNQHQAIIPELKKKKDDDAYIERSLLIWKTSMDEKYKEIYEIIINQHIFHIMYRIGYFYEFTINGMLSIGRLKQFQYVQEKGCKIIVCHLEEPTKTIIQRRVGSLIKAANYDDIVFAVQLYNGNLPEIIGYLSSLVHFYQCKLLCVFKTIENDRGKQMKKERLLYEESCRQSIYDMPQDDLNDPIAFALWRKAKISSSKSIVKPNLNGISHDLKSNGTNDAPRSW